ncbi:Gfo/Idh/MocA family oxidoreductase [Flammeovirga sp. MY04]|nr:Gfo/Idh/MocA family oxidoreductase [Flammeovirga sp. MY04]ANQ52196.1 Gfo/Idh/MocA family oxidoreductase [Flammeovirga sp. MY04]
MRSLITYLILLLGVTNLVAQNPIKIGVAGMTHGHVHGLLGDKNNKDIVIVGIAESNTELVDRYQKMYGFDQSIVYSDLEEMLDKTKPDAVLGFGNIYDHLKIVELCAPRGIHVMVEKPLAVNMDHAKKMKALADKYKIELLTNYETTWYGSHEKLYEEVQKGAVGEVKKVMVNDGHKGPKKIGVEKEFLSWLTDPKLNGGGAIVDFGCYGANLMTWLNKGEKPLSVTAVTSQLQKENNPNVDDESIIILKYKDQVGVVQGSWNWPIGRKDMEVYGEKGVITAENHQDVNIKISTGYNTFDREDFHIKERSYPYNNPFSYFTAIINKEIKVTPYNLSSLENNMIVVEILDAARKSAKSHKEIKLN